VVHGNEAEVVDETYEDIDALVYDPNTTSRS
jgi:hypothetical protein